MLDFSHVIARSHECSRVHRIARDCTGWQRFPTPLGMADTEPQEVVPGAPGNDLMNALRYDSALSRTRHPWPPDILPRSHPPDAYLQTPARARPTGKTDRPGPTATDSCAARLPDDRTDLHPHRPHPLRLPSALRTSARKAKPARLKAASTSPSRHQPHQHLTATLVPAPQDAHHRGAPQGG